MRDSNGMQIPSTLDIKMAVQSRLKKYINRRITVDVERDAGIWDCKVEIGAYEHLHGWCWNYEVPEDKRKNLHCFQVADIILEKMKKSKSAYFI